MNKERALKKIAGGLFAEIFRMGKDMGRAVNLKTEKKAKDVVGYLDRRYLLQKKSEFAKKLKKAGILPIK
jgi:hypothetical protein